MKSHIVAKKLASFVSSLKKTAGDEPSEDSVKPEDINWTEIVHHFAHAVWSDKYIMAVDEATGETGHDPEDGELRLEQSPWGAGSQLLDYVPDMPDGVVSTVDAMLVKAFGKDAILADAAKFMSASGEDEEKYGWYLCMQEMGRGVGLGDYGYETELPQHETSVEHNNHGYLYGSADKVIFDFTCNGKNFEVDVTDELGHLVVDGTDDEDDA